MIIKKSIYIYLYLFLITIILFNLYIKSNKNKVSEEKVSEEKVNKVKASIIKTLVRQSARWTAAADQDESPIIRLLHANYGAAYLWALRDIATNQEIEEVTNLNVLDLQKLVLETQDSATKNVSKICTDFTGDINEYLLKIAGDK